MRVLRVVVRVTVSPPMSPSNMSLWEHNQLNLVSSAQQQYHNGTRWDQPTGEYIQ